MKAQTLWVFSLVVVSLAFLVMLAVFSQGATTSLAGPGFPRPTEVQVGLSVVVGEKIVPGQGQSLSAGQPLTAIVGSVFRFAPIVVSAPHNNPLVSFSATGTFDPAFLQILSIEEGNYPNIDNFDFSLYFAL